MYVLAIFAVFAMLIAAWQTVGMEQMEFVPSASAQALALNMALYRQSVIDYVLANPAFQGSVAASQLPAVAGYRPNALWRNYVQGNTVVVYATSQQAAQVVSDMSQLALGSVLAGVAENGTEVPPGNPSVAIPLPAAIAGSIPNGMPVWIAQVYPS